MPEAKLVSESLSGSNAGSGKLCECSPEEVKPAPQQQSADDRISSRTTHDQKTGSDIIVSRVPRANWLSRLATVFPVGGTLHKPTEAARSYLLAETIGKRYPGSNKFVVDFRDYLKDVQSGDSQAQYFLDVVFSALSQGLWGDIDSETVGSFAELVLNMDEAFYCLIVKICSHPSQILLSVVERCLELDSKSDVNNNKLGGGQANRLVNKPLIFGETPLIYALRHKSPKVTHLLLKWGADVNASWMNFRNPLEALLFSPNDISVTSEQEASICECAGYLCSLLPVIDVVSLRELEKEGYYPLLPDWQEMLSTLSARSSCGIRTESSSSPSNLSHHCRLVIRASLLRAKTLPQGAARLYLPKLLRDYVDLEIQ